MKRCPFCLIIAGLAPAEVIHEDNLAWVIKPLNPVTPGHLLVIPTVHVADFTENPAVSGFAMFQAARIAAELGPCNLITSKGVEATQSVFHLHLHVVPRQEDDGLALPWYSGRKSRRTKVGA